MTRMSTTIFKAISVLDDNAYLFKKNGNMFDTIKMIPREESLPFISPGLVDTQVNGFHGHDYTDHNLSITDCITICRTLIKTGTLQHFATIVTSPKETILHSLKTIVEARETEEIARHSITGIHIEGPFISPEDGFRGAHNLSSVRNADIIEFDSWWKIAGELIKVITVAPEVPQVIDLIKHATAHGVVCAIGHTNANLEQIESAIDAGASVSTHLGNGSKSVIDRLNNHIWIQLAEDRLKASMISDLIHIPEPTLKVFARAKGSKRIILVSDMAPMAGTCSGKKKWGDISVEVNDDTSIRLSGTPYLAGASSSLLRNVVNFHIHTGTSLAESIAMATIQPTQHYSLDMNRLHFTPGEIAECILFNLDYQSGKATLKEIISPYDNY